MKDDGTVDLDIKARNLGHSKKEILLASYPAFDGEKDERSRKRGIIVIDFYIKMEIVRPCWQRWEVIPLRLRNHQVITFWEWNPFSSVVHLLIAPMLPKGSLK